MSQIYHNLKIRKYALGGSFAMLLMLVMPLMALASTITVDTSTDEFGAGAGCSLREAIQSANTNTAFGGCATGAVGMDIINIPTGIYTLTITGSGEDLNATGDLDVATDTAGVTLNGTGTSAASVVINGNNLSDRVIHATSTNPLTLTNLTIQGGAASSAGGGARFGGTGTVSGTIFINNSATTTGGGASFAGIATVVETTFISNTAAQGGGVYFNGSSTAKSLVNTLFSRNNGTTDGAAIYVNNASLVQIIHTTIATPTTVANKQAIYIQAGTVYITNSIIASYTTGISNTSGTVKENYNLFYGNGTTTTNVTNGVNSLTGQNPLFTAPASDNYHLQTGSPAGGAGTPLGILTDYDGDTRSTTAPAPGYDEVAAATTGPLVYQSPVGSQMTLRLNSGTLEVVSSSIVVASKLYSLTTYILVTGTNSANDKLTVDFSGGNPITGSLTYAGGSGGNDTLALANGTVNTIGHTFNTASSGAINIDGKLLNYSGLEPVSDTLTAGIRIFTFTTSANLVTISDDGTPNDEISQIASDASETTTFTVPTTALYIYTLDGNDVITFAGLDSGFTRTIPVYIDGGNPTSAPGDELRYLTGTQTVTGTYDGYISGSSIPTVTYTSIESYSTCYAQAVSGATGQLFASSDASALRSALNDATAGTTVKVAGYCAGVSGTTVVTITQNVTVRGSYTIADGLTTSQPGVYTATLDALGAGRVVNITGGTVTLEGLKITNGKISTGDGAGIALASSAIRLAISGSLVYSNVTSNGNGGGIYLAKAGAISFTTILSNNASLHGGGIYADTTATILNILNSSFQNNRANNSRDGGGLYANLTTLILTTTYFTSNQASGSGGAIFLFNGSTLTLSSSQFNSNSASNGGAIATHSTSGVVTMSNTYFWSNSATSGLGGAMSLAGTSPITIINSEFMTNSITGSGGAIASSNSSSLNIMNTLLQNNSATQKGGAIYSSGGNLVLTNTTVTSNTSSLAGGGINAEAGSSINVTQSIIQGNVSSTNGGGLNNAISGQIVNTLLARNHANGNGAAIQSTAGTLKIIHATIVSTTLSTKEGIYVTGGNTFVTNTIVTSHGIGIRQTGGIVTQTYNLFYANTTNTSGTVNGGTGTINADPAFFNTSAYTLSSISGAINNGTDAGITTDYFSSVRPQGGGYDIGYHETNYQADLALTKSVIPTNGVAGTAITYTLNFTASGTGGLFTNIVLTDTIPVSVTNLAVISSGVTITNTGVIPSYVFSIANMSVGQSGRITITGNLSNPLTAHVFTNTALITTTTTQSDTTNDTSSAAITVGQVILSLTKQVTPTLNVTYHGIATYTVVLSNSGSTDASGVLFTDTLPVSTTFASWITQPSGAINSSSQITWTGQVTANSIITLSFSVSHTQAFGDVITNTAQMNYSGIISNALATFTVTKQPIVTNSTYITAEDTVLTVSAANGVLSTTYASDPDGDSLIATLAVSPTQGTFTFNSDGSFVYTPANNFSGTDMFTYTVSDGHGGVATGTVTITVNPANDAPIVGNSKVLYDGALGTLPATQSFTYTNLDSVSPFTPDAVQTLASGGVRLNSTADMDDYAGYSYNGTTLNRNTGYTLRFATQISVESHSSVNRAGFSVIAISSDGQYGIELGFWTNRIFAQEGGISPLLFTAAEAANFNTTSVITYELTISGQAYSLVANSNPVLTGSLRDYSAFVGALDPYQTPNYVFFGDDTTSAQADFRLNYVSVITNTTPPDRTVASYTTLPMSDLGVMDLDSGGSSETLTMTVNSGVLTVTSGLSGITLNGNGTNTVIITGSVPNLNNLLAYSATYVTYRSNLGFYGTDTLTMLLNDKGNTGGGALMNSKSFNILVTSPAFSITKSVNNLTPQPNERITYTVIVTNYGNVNATNVRISDTLPSGLSFAGPVTMNPTQGGATLASSAGNLPSLATGVTITNNQSITLTFPVTVTASDGTLITNTASVTSAEVSTPVSHSVRITVTGIPVLTISKTVTPTANVTYHGAVTYTVIITNSGTANATGVLFTDTIPVSTTFKSWLIQPSGTVSSGGQITRNGIVTANQSITFSFVVSHNANYDDVVANTASINYNNAVSSSVATFTVASAPAACYARVNGIGTIYGSADAQAVRDAVSLANSGDMVYIAGYCAGVVTQNGTPQVVLITKSLTLQGGYTTTNWVTPDVANNVTILDALVSGRVISASSDIGIIGLTIQNAKYSVASRQGGGIYAAGALTLTNSILVNNIVNGAFSLGAGLYVQGTALVSGVQILTNTSSSSGGGAYFNGITTITNTTFSNNIANGSGSGGGAYFNNIANITNTIFISNNSKVNGAGAYFSNSSTAIVQETNFISNTSDNHAGGAYFAGTSYLTKTYFIKNIASNYGGGSFFVGTAYITATDYLSNIAQSLGGGAYFQNTGNVTDTQFVNNQSILGSGGGIYFNSQQGNLMRTIFISNTSNNSGGGVGLFGGAGSTQIVNSLFVRNKSMTNEGDQMYLGSAGNVFVMHSTIATSTQTNRVAIYVNGVTAYITNTIIVSHATGIYRLAGTVFENNNLFYGNATNLSGSNITSGGNSVTGAAAFYNTTNYTLTASSAAIDVGTDLGITTDYFGNTRPQQLAPDIGYAESPFAAVFTCYATSNDGVKVYGSNSSQAVRDAVASATSGATVKISGYCAGVQAQLGTTQTVIITQPLTLAGGYTTTNWTTPNTTTNPTTLDAQLSGRVIYATSPLTVQNMTVQSGTWTVSGENGGGIYTTQNITLSGVTVFSNATTNATFPGGGGGLYQNAGTVTLIDTVFKQNYSKDSGSGLFTWGNMVLTNTQFLTNTASNTGAGAVVIGSSIVNGGLFQGNLAGGGTGGLYAGGGVTLTGTQFIKNTALAGGAGGLYLPGTANSRVVNALFVGNQSSNAGSVMQIPTTGIVEIIHTTMVSSTLPITPAISVSNGTTYITNTIVASYAVAIERTGGTVIEDYNLFYGNTTNIVGTVTSGGNSIIGNPNFVNPAAYNYRLNTGSAAVDMGTDLGITSDFEGGTRPFASALPMPDIGYDESPYLAGADLQVSKSVTPTLTIVGQRITYTVSFSNAASSYHARTVLLTDIIPVSLTNLSLITNVSNNVTMTQTAGYSYAWTLSNFGPGASGRITVSGDISSNLVVPTRFTNTASITTSTIDTNPNNNTASVGVDVTTVVLTISKTSAYTGGQLQPYQTLTYTIRVTNTSSVAASNATISDTLPSSVTFVNQLGGNSSGFSGGIVTWTVNSLAANGNTVLTYVVTVNNVVSGTIITNTAQVTSNEVITPSTATITDVVKAYIDLAASKSVNTTSPAVGDVVTFTVLITNSGISTATNVVITDALPSGLSLASNTPSQGSFAMPTWTVGTITPSTRVTLTVVATVTSGSPMTNAVQVQSVDQTDSDSTPNDGTGDDYAKVIITPTYAVLAITKSVTPTTNVPYHGQVTYTIVISNMSAVNAVNTTLSDTLPVSTTFSSWITQSGAIDTPSLITWNGQVMASQRITFSFVADHIGANYGEVVTNTSVVSYANFVTTSNTATFSVAHIITLTLDKNSVYTGATLQPNQTITYTVTVTNSGSGAASNVTISDTLPANTTLVGGSASATSGTPSFGTSPYKWTIPSLVPNSPQTLTFRVIVNSGVASGTNIINMATVTSSEVTNAISDTVTNTVSYPVADLQINKTIVGSSTVLAGNQITYTLTITNLGPNSVNAATVTDTFTGTGTTIASSLISSTASACTHSSPNIICNLSNVTGTNVITIVLNTSASYSGTLTNTAMITFGNGIIASDNNNTDNQTGNITATVRYRQTDLTMSKARVGTGYVPAGQPITYTLTVTNNGLDVVSAVVTDTFTGTATLSSMTPSVGSCTLGTRSCNLTNLAVGTPQMITVVLTTGSFSGTLTNSATISATGSFIIMETDSSNNTSAEITTSVQLPVADIEVSKTQVNVGQIIAGSQITYSVVITNNGPDTANITLTDTFTGSYAAVNYSGACGTGSALPFSCTLNGFTGTQYITVVLTTNSFSGTLTNTAFVTFTSGVTAVDSVVSNNNSTVTTSVRYPTADLQISKARVGSGTVLPGGQITYTITITNLGPDTASVTVTDTYTGTASSVVSNTTSGSCTLGAQPVCSIPNFTNTQTITFVMTTSAGFSGIFSNSAKIGLAVANGTDPNLTDNVSEVITALVAGTDLQVSKSVNTATPVGNSNVIYTLQMRNNGPDDATGVIVNDILPAGVTYVASNTVTGSYNNGTGDWTIGNIAKNSTVSLQITAQTDAVVANTIVTNTATLMAVTPTDINAANDIATATITIQRPQVSFVPASYSVGETGGSTTIIATLNATSTGTVTVDYNVTGGTATNGTDYGVTNGTLTFLSGTTAQTFTVVITDDVIFEGNETVGFSLSNVSSNATIGTANATLTIVDNEVPPNASPTAQSNLYTVSQSSILTVTAPGILGNDSDPENNPLTTVLGSSTTHGTLVLNSNGSFIYTPAFGYVGSDYFVYQAFDGTSNSNPATVTITVQALTPPTAVDDSYTTLPNTPLTISAGAGVLVNDSDPYSYTFTATLVSGPSNGQLSFNSNGSFVYTPTLNFTGNDSYVYQIITTKGSTATATVNIGVNSIPTVSFMLSSYTVGEATGSAIIGVNLNQAYPVTVTVNYQTSAGTATAGTDYGNATGQLTFAPSITLQTFTVPITDDTLDENNETVSLLLSGAVNAVITNTNPAALTITDDDLPPTVNFNGATVNVNEGTGNIILTVTLNNPSGLTITVPYSTSNGTATAGSDYGAVSGVLTFTPGMTTATIVIPIINDGLAEGNETFQATLTGATNAVLGGTAITTITITDNTSLPTVQFATASQTVNETAGNATIPVLLSAVSGTTVTVNYATSDNTALAGSDYQAMSGTLTFTPGTVMLSFNIPITDDTFTESNELVNLTLTSPTNATLGTPSTALLTITDNDVITPITGLVAFNDSPTLLGQATTLSATVTAGSGISYTWSLGDGTVGTGNIVLHTYPAGVYTAVVTATNGLSQLTATTVITILEPITGLVVVSDAPTSLGKVTQFSATVTAGNFIDYTFDFGDNSPLITLPANWTEGNLTGVLLGHAYGASGTYTITVIANNGVSTAVATTTVTVIGSASNPVIDLAVAKMVVSPDRLGHLMTYTLVVTNFGPDMATNVTLTDTLPSAVTLVNTPTNCLGTNVLVCNVGALASEASTSLSLQVIPNQLGLITNTVEAGAEQSEFVTNNNVATATTMIGHALAVIDPISGGTLVYTNSRGNVIQIDVPNDNALSEPVVLLLTEQENVTSTPANYLFANYAFNLAFYQNGQLLPNYVVTSPVTITLDNTSISTTNLVLMYNDNSQWVDAATICNPASRYVIDPTNSTMQITVCQIPGDFALFQTKPRPFIYLPIILQSEAALTTPTPTITPISNPQADLIGSFSLSPAKTNFAAGELVAITVVITNQGTAVANAFWVDFFINPTTPPQNASKVWSEQCTLSPCYGLAWQVLGLAPGQSITLTSSSTSYSSQHTKWSGLFAAGTSDLYLYVDTWSADRSPNGYISESNENNNRAEMHGLVVAGAKNAVLSPFSLELPERDLPR